MTTRRTLLAVHAHPDDESSSMGGTLAWYADRGIRTVVVTCTGGEVGEISSDHLATPENLAEVRAGEMAAAAEILGLTRTIQLGYRDSGMAGTPENDHPASFHRADPDEAIRRLVAIMREERPQVVVTYDENGGYGHPDHIKAHLIATAAFEAAGDPARYPEAGEAWSPTKLYHTAFPRSVAQALVQAWQEAGIDLPFDPPPEAGPGEAPPPFGTPDELVTTAIPVRDYLERKQRALLAHQTQITPDTPWLRLPPEKSIEIWSHEHFRLVRGPTPAAAGEREDDLFAGL